METQNVGNKSRSKKSLNLLPGIIIILLQWLIRYGIKVVFPNAAEFGVLGGLAGGLAVIIWWAFFSKAQKSERWFGSLFILITLVATTQLSHVSIKTGMQGMMFFALATPLVSLGFVAWAVLSQKLEGRLRIITMIASILITSSVFLLARSEGITGDAKILLAWRWTASAEEKFLANAEEELTESKLKSGMMSTEVEWPGFRGPKRDAVVLGTMIGTDWEEKPPVELWRKPVGPGCSSFSVHGDLIFTQEQHGEDEIVSCYKLSTGEAVWKYTYPARFWDSHAGAGPRSTPTIKNGRVYTVGATGILNALNEEDGSVIWSINAAEDINAELPGWGFTSSPLIIDDAVIIAITGTLLAYDIENGEKKWFGSNGGLGYSSPHLYSNDNVEQVLLMSQVGVSSFKPGNGEMLWQLDWDEERIVQPAIASNGDLLISAGGIQGMKRLTVSHKKDTWKIDEKWTTSEMKPNFNDIVIHKNHVYGFNGPILTCVNIEDGKRAWKGSRLGGQLLLLSDQDLLLIISEKGEVVLVDTNPKQYIELARFSAIKGKTWNHPVLINDVLLVRNTQEMAAFKLPKAVN